MSMSLEPRASALTLPAAIIVDDEPAVLNVHRRVLARRFDVVAVATAEAALAHIESGRFFDVMFCDYSLPGPGMSGRDLFLRLCSAHPEQAARLTILSGAAEPGRNDDFTRALRHRWLEKPVPPAELLLYATSFAERDAA